MLQVVLCEKHNIAGEYYDGWYIDSMTNEPKMYTIYGDATSAKVMKMYGFHIQWGDNPPPDCIKEKLMKDYRPVPVKVVLLT